MTNAYFDEAVFDATIFDDVSGGSSTSKSGVDSLAVTVTDATVSLIVRLYSSDSLVVAETEATTRSFLSVDTLTLADTEGTTKQFLSTDSLVLVPDFDEVHTLASGLTKYDSLLIAGGGLETASSIIATVPAIESIFISSVLETASSIVVYLSSSDSLVVNGTEGTTRAFTSLDSLTVVGTDATALLEARIGSTDSIIVTDSTELPVIAIRITGTDSLTVTSTDAAQVTVQLGGTDSLVVTESEVSTRSFLRQDTISVVETETVPFFEKSIVATDSLVVSGAADGESLGISFTRQDSLLPKITDSGLLTVRLYSSDSLVVAGEVDGDFGVVVVIVATDSLLTEAQDTIITTDVAAFATDSLKVRITSTTYIPGALPLYETISGDSCITTSITGDSLICTHVTGDSIITDSFGG